MKISNEDRKQILKGFIDVFTRIASKPYQKRIWIHGKGPEVDDFDDTVNDFFGECDSILEDYKGFGITDSQYQILKKFRDKFRKFSDENNWPHKFIETQEWEKITEMANEILKAFNYKKIRK
jgi:hypothetical protein